MSKRTHRCPSNDGPFSFSTYAMGPIKPGHDRAPGVLQPHIRILFHPKHRLRCIELLHPKERAPGILQVRNSRRAVVVELDAQPRRDVTAVALGGGGAATIDGADGAGERARVAGPVCGGQLFAEHEAEARGPAQRLCEARERAALYGAHIRVCFGGEGLERVPGAGGHPVRRERIRLSLHRGADQRRFHARAHVVLPPEELVECGPAGLHDVPIKVGVAFSRGEDLFVRRGGDVRAVWGAFGLERGFDIEVELVAGQALSDEAGQNMSKGE